MYRKILKPCIDSFLAFWGILILSPLMIFLAILIRIKLGSPVIFRQWRPGLNEKLFLMYKFRSMSDCRDENGTLLPDSQRLTAFGKKLRASSMDELPELFNILKGNMSFVGPRPQLVRDMVFMSPDQRKRHQVMPGLTGLAQVNGRNGISWEEKLNWDIKYTENISFLLDIKIILKTFVKVFRQEDISTSGLETAEDFGDYLFRTGSINRTEYIQKNREAERLLKNNG